MNSKLSFLKSTTLAILLASGAIVDIARAAEATATRDFTDFQLITERNIFDPNRRPRVRSESARPRQVVDSFSFSGTMSYAKGLFAFFDGNSAEYRKVVEPGEKIAGYTVTEIGHDLVKLVQDTNEVQLKVGMQMRRSEDGKWYPAEGSSSGGGSGGSGGGYASNNSRWGSNRSERRSNGNGNGNGGERYRNSNRQYNNGNNGNNNGGSSSPAEGFGQPMPMPTADVAPTPPPDAAGMDPNDPVARLMMRRLQETGGGPPAEATGQVIPGNPNESGNPGDAPNGQGNPNGYQFENPDRGNGSTNLNVNDNPN